MARSAMVLVLFLAGCGAVSPVYRARSGLRPNDTERGVERAFQSFGIPVVEHNLDGRVRSGRFDPGVVFAGQLQERVACGATSEVGSLTAVRPAELEVIATIRSNAMDGTRIELESWGWGRDRDGKKIQCRLSSAAAGGILAAVAGAPPAFPRSDG